MLDGGRQTRVGKRTHGDRNAEREPGKVEIGKNNQGKEETVLVLFKPLTATENR